MEKEKELSTRNAGSHIHLAGTAGIGIQHSCAPGKGLFHRPIRTASIHNDVLYILGVPRGFEAGNDVFFFIQSGDDDGNFRDGAVHFFSDFELFYTLFPDRKVLGPVHIVEGRENMHTEPQSSGNIQGF